MWLHLFPTIAHCCVQWTTPSAITAHVNTHAHISLEFHAPVIFITKAGYTKRILHNAHKWILYFGFSLSRTMMGLWRPTDPLSGVMAVPVCYCRHIGLGYIHTVKITWGSSVDGWILLWCEIFSNKPLNYCNWVVFFSEFYYTKYSNKNKIKTFT